MKTIKRNATKQIAAIKAKNLVCHLHHYMLDYVAKEEPVDKAWTAWASSRSATLTALDDGRYMVQVSPRCWYYLTELTS